MLERDIRKFLGTEISLISLILLQYFPVFFGPRLGNSNPEEFRGIISIENAIIGNGHVCYHSQFVAVILLILRAIGRRIR